MHIYAFGSICRGDIDLNSDIDLLAIVHTFDNRFSPAKFSIYSYNKIKEIWDKGNPFAWHLSTESRLLYSSNSKNFLADLGKPQAYTNVKHDCENFYQLFCDSLKAINLDSNSHVFELSTMFLAIRNFATCYALGVNNQHEYSRLSAIHLDKNSIPIKNDILNILMRSRILSTRGHGEPISNDEVKQVLFSTNLIKQWMSKLLKEVTNE